jgi:hypothetical protein
MKVSNVEEVMEIGEKLQRIRIIRSWLTHTIPLRGLQLYSNGLIGMIEIPHATSISLLDEAEQGCLERLKELGVEQ